MQPKQRSVLREMRDRPWLVVIYLVFLALGGYVLTLNGVIPTWAELKRDFRADS